VTPIPSHYAPPRVVCAALREDGGEIILGPRHLDDAMRVQIAHSQTPDLRYWSQAEQGFIDQYGRFLTREEAFVIATEAGQFFRECGSEASGLLYSENLY